MPVVPALGRVIFVEAIVNFSVAVATACYDAHAIFGRDGEQCNVIVAKWAGLQIVFLLSYVAGLVYLGHYSSSLGFYLRHIIAFNNA